MVRFRPFQVYRSGRDSTHDFYCISYFFPLFLAFNSTYRRRPLELKYRIVVAVFIQRSEINRHIKMELADRAVGFLLSIISLSIFTYYTFWVIILPFVDGDHFIHKYFLPQEYAILIPVSAGMALLCFLCIFIGFVMLKSKKKAA